MSHKANCYDIATGSNIQMSWINQTVGRETLQSIDTRLSHSYGSNLLEDCEIKKK
jgi:hypothetical protein